MSTLSMIGVDDDRAAKMKAGLEGLASGGAHLVARTADRIVNVATEMAEAIGRELDNRVSGPSFG